MKKTYNKLVSEVLLVELEQGFMGASVRLNPLVEVNPYETFTGDNFKDDGSFDVTFE